MDGLRGRGSSRVRRYGGLEYRCTKPLGLGVWYSTVCEGGCRFMTAWVREAEKASENRQRKRLFGVALIGPTQGLPKRSRLCLFDRNV